jgi:hypothetical protein
LLSGKTPVDGYSIWSQKKKKEVDRCYSLKGFCSEILTEVWIQVRQGARIAEKRGRAATAKRVKAAVPRRTALSWRNRQHQNEISVSRDSAGTDVRLGNVII